jgi:hypothetical protein
MGEGLLNYRQLIERVRPDSRGINQIVEHWLPWQQDAQRTCQLEQQWTQQSVDYLAKHQFQE